MGSFSEESCAVSAHATVLIARVARVLRQRLEQTLAPLGLRERHVVALSYLGSHRPTAQRTFADRLSMDASSTVCLLNELDDHGLVVRQRDRSDRRRAVVELSPRGELALLEVNRALEAVENEILGGLDAAERALLHGLLARLGAGEPDWGLVSSLHDAEGDDARSSPSRADRLSYIGAAQAKRPAAHEHTSE